MKRLISLTLALVMLCVAAFDSVSVLAMDPSYRKGSDISEHNGDFNLTAQKNNGDDFVMIRLGYYTHLDKRFYENVRKAVANEMDFGVYLYSYAYSNNEAKLEAQFVVNVLNSLPEEYLEYMNLPVAYDLEEPAVARRRTKKQITKQMTLFCDAIAAEGYTPMVYANTDWFVNYIDIAKAYKKGYKIWYAYYANYTPTFDSVKQIGTTGYYPDMWQYSTSHNKLDRNVMYPSMGCAVHTFEEKVVEPTCTEGGYTLSVCSECGFSRKSAKTSATGHTAELATKAEIGKDGSYICTTCGEEQIIYQPQSFTLSTTSYEYNGEVRKPTVTVTDSMGNALVKGEDYTVTYPEGRKYVGKYKVKIKLIGKYKGSQSLYFKIKPKSTSVKSLKARSKGFNVNWKKKTAQTSGYEIMYSTSKSFGWSQTIVVKDNTKTSKKLRGLAGGTRYYVKVRTYKIVDGKKHYSSWSKKMSVVTKR